MPETGRRRIARERDPLWYKDAIIYELHVRSFCDSNGDGIGDFPGLIQKLDYVQSLGVTCIWLLPFYPSPLRDDGYDISDYTGVNPAYGTLRDFKAFLREAHARDLRVFTELVVNHTSDQHPWFQASRRAPKGSTKRDYYVWSDTGQEYAGTRIIFSDTETSNWTWDPVAKAYYWHRFFSHQPDLNYDNPHVLKAVLRVMRFWLDLGVDGLRLDAVPYLVEREGTACEHLPETHAVLKALRAEVDRRYDTRALLAEANAWPADVRPYFGDGDECHMAYHFPLMPRLFMAIQQGDALPIAEILRQTPELPGGGQWALFLRNHDELTLEVVTDEERDYMYRAYAADPQMRINAGIRRRLAPLMEFSRPRIELLNSLLLSLPGSPIVYYGDEIGMGDNIYLGDRSGVRTPMQWTGDRNAGFSRADPARLFAPPVMDPVYGYQAINVEAQERSPASLLNWMRRMIGLRRQYRTFGRGRLDLIRGDNRRVLAFVRDDDEHRILVVANLAGTMQPVSLDLSRFRGLRPVEMIGETALPPVGDAPYLLTLGPHAFYWLRLTPAPDAEVASCGPAWPGAADPPVVLWSGHWDRLLDEHPRRLLERDALPGFLARQRWFTAGHRRIHGVRIVDWATLAPGPRPLFLAVLHVTFDDGRVAEYVQPLATEEREGAARVIDTHGNAVVARLSGARTGVLYDATVDPAWAALWRDAFAGGVDLPLVHGRIVFSRLQPSAGLAATDDEPSPVMVEGDARGPVTALVGEGWLLKLWREIDAGDAPEIEVGRALGAGAGAAHVPALIAWAAYRRRDEGARPVALLRARVASRGSGWERALDELRAYLSAMAGAGVVPSDDRSARRLAAAFATERALREAGDALGAPPARLAEAVEALVWMLDATFVPPAASGG